NLRGIKAIKPRELFVCFIAPSMIAHHDMKVLWLRINEYWVTVGPAVKMACGLSDTLAKVVGCPVLSPVELRDTWAWLDDALQNWIQGDETLVAFDIQEFLQCIQRVKRLHVSLIVNLHAARPDRRLGESRSRIAGECLLKNGAVGGKVLDIRRKRNGFVIGRNV